jgi:hypothetical protein
LVPRQPYQNANTQNVKGQNPKFKFDGFAKSREMSFSVIPANPGSGSGTGAGIQEKRALLDPGFRRGNGFNGFSRDRQF